MSNNTPVDIKVQVARITKPLASTIEMADAGNIVITHKLRGLVTGSIGKSDGGN